MSINFIKTISFIAFSFSITTGEAAVITNKSNIQNNLAKLSSAYGVAVSALQTAITNRINQSETMEVGNSDFLPISLISIENKHQVFDFAFIDRYGNGIFRALTKHHNNAILSYNLITDQHDVYFIVVPKYNSKTIGTPIITAVGDTTLKDYVIKRRQPSDISYSGVSIYTNADDWIENAAAGPSKLPSYSNSYSVNMQYLPLSDLITTFPNVFLNLADDTTNIGMTSVTSVTSVTNMGINTAIADMGLTPDTEHDYSQS